MKSKRSYLLFCLLGILMLGNINAFAQMPAKNAHGKPGVAKKKFADKTHARKAIRKTAIVIRNAQLKVKANKNYTGDLSRAIAHQRFARKMYIKGMYVKALRHTRAARIFARKAIKANKGSDIAEANFTPEEEELMKDSPSDQELMDEIVREEAKPVIDDSKFANEASDIDLGENE